jgi:apolipoprotein N-acyltransferase
MSTQAIAPLAGDGAAHPCPADARGETAPGRRAVSGWALLGLGSATALLLWLCYFPVAWGWLAWVALVPLLALTRAEARALNRYAAAWLAGLAFYFPALQWFRIADDRMYFTWIFLALVCSLYLPLAVLLVRVFARRLPAVPLLVTFPVVWVALEFFRSSFIGGFASAFLGHHQHDFPGGFSWYLLGHSQHDYLPLIQIADLGGAYAVSFLLAVGNVLLFETLFARRGFRAWLAPGSPPALGKRGLLVQGLAFLLLLTASVGYGFWQLGRDTQEPGPRLALIQGNLDQRIRNTVGSADAEESEQATRTVVNHYVFLADRAAEAGPDLIVWPETSAVDYWVELRPGEPAPISKKLARLCARRWKTNVLLGLNALVGQEGGGQKRYNSALLIHRWGGEAGATYLIGQCAVAQTLTPAGGPFGSIAQMVVASHLAQSDAFVLGEAAGRYDKTHRVPFGEFVPFRKSLPWMNEFAPYDYDYSVSPGKSFTRFPLRVGGREYTFGVVICYEDTIADMARPYAGGDGGPAADFLLNISNDGWFDGSSEHDQHLAICRFRAVECRRSVARSVNMGISAVVDANGRVLAPHRLDVPPPPAMPEARAWRITEEDFGGPGLPVSRWQEYKKVPGVLLATIPIDTRGSLYARWGDWLGWGCLVAVLGGLAVGLIRGRAVA